MKTVIAILITLCILACTSEDSKLMHEALMQAKAQNENFEPFTTDSTMLRVVDYYDAHGSANEQMLASKLFLTSAQTSTISYSIKKAQNL